MKNAILAKIQKIREKMQPISVYLAAITAIVAAFYIGYVSGEVHGARSIVPEGEGRVVVDVQAEDLEYESLSEDVEFSMFWDVWNLVKDQYLYRPVSEKDLFYGAIDGIVAALDDPYSTYFDPAEALEFEQDLSGTFFGIGAEIDERDGYIVVVSPLRDSPAETAGLLAGDRILFVDGEELLGVTATEAVRKIRGDLGTDVILTVQRDESEELIDITITRGEITIDSVTWEIREDGIGVISLAVFNEDTTELFAEASQEMLSAGVDQVIIDLRNNPGGLLTSAIDILGFWIEDRPAVIERVGDLQTPYTSSGSGQLASMETVVLINGGSASASEIVSGALQDYGLSTLIGETTFGKGSVQEFIPYSDGSALKLTTAEWLTPLGRSINNTGIDPDILIEYTLEDYNEQKTPQIDAAIDFLSGR